MKELSIKEKAKAYDEALKRAKNHHDNDGLTLEQYETIDIIFPELRESKDERMRKAIIEGLRAMKSSFHTISSIKIDDAIAWLEKQGEQKPANKVNPKFKVGDIIRHKKKGFTCKITAADTEYSVSDCCGTHLPFDSQDAYELVEQNPALGEEDEEIIEALNTYVKNLDIFFSEIKIGDKDILAKEFREKVQHWLKSLKDRV